LKYAPSSTVILASIAEDESGAPLAGMPVAALLAARASDAHKDAARVAKSGQSA